VAALHTLRDALQRYADAHGGAWPPHDADPSIAEAAWIEPTSGQRYIYIPSTRAPGAPPRALALEPAAVAGARLALLNDGTVALAEDALVRDALRGDP
jgi:hypothetical protein